MGLVEQRIGDVGLDGGQVGDGQADVELVDGQVGNGRADFWLVRTCRRWTARCGVSCSTGWRWADRCGVS